MNDNFNLLMKTYLQCVKTATKEVMLHYKGENWFSYLKEKDEKRKHPILYMCETIDDLDFQACNKLLIYNRELWNNFCRFYNKEHLFKKKFDGDKKEQEKEPYEKYEIVAFDLIQFRNDYQGHYSFSENKEQEYRAECMRAVDNMRFIMSGIFANVYDNVTGKRYIELFQEQMLQFYIAGEKRRYYLKDYISKEEYDYSLFFTECARLGIHPEMDDCEEVFYSSDIQKDILILKNALKKLPEKDDQQIDDATPQELIDEIEVEEPVIEEQIVGEHVEEKLETQAIETKQDNKKIVIISIIIAIFFCVLFVLALLLPKAGKKEQLTLESDSIKWIQEDGSLWCYATVLNEQQIDVAYEKLIVDMELTLSDESTRKVQMVFRVYDIGKEDTRSELTTCTSFEELQIADGVTIKSMSFTDYRFE